MPLCTGPPKTIDDLNIEAETRRTLKQAGICTVQDILETEGGKGLQKVGGIWQKQYRDIRDALSEYGISMQTSAVPSAKLPTELSPPARGIPIGGLHTNRETTAEPKEEELTESPPLLEVVRPFPQRESKSATLGLRTVVFIDYEHWYIGLKRQLQRKPNIQAWFDNAKQRGRLLEVTFFGDFSDSGGMRDEISRIRLFTNRIIETGNIGNHLKKDFTDFIILDNIYQKIIASPEIEQVILFTGDGHFSSVASYLRNFCSKVVGIYAVDDALSVQLEATSDWCVKLPLDVEKYVGCREAILTNLKYAEEHAKTPTFHPTIRLVSEHYNLDEDLVESELRRMLGDGTIYTVPTRSRRDYTSMINVLKVNWNQVAQA